MDKAKVLEFFDGKPEAMRVFDGAARAIAKAFPSAVLRVQKTQISFDDPLGFAYVWMPPHPVKSQPDAPVVLSFVLPYQLENPRIPNVTFVRQDRYTHHIPLTARHNVDGEILGWLKEAHDLMRVTRRRKAT